MPATALSGSSACSTMPRSRSRGRGCGSSVSRYKAKTSDMRESPALKIIELLQKRGADLVYHDPYVPGPQPSWAHERGLRRDTRGADLAVIVTAHPDVDYTTILDRVPLVIDLRPRSCGSGCAGRRPMTRRSDIGLRIFAGIYLVAVLVGILFYRSTVTHVFANPIFAIYGIIVATYLLTRYVLSLFYRAYPDAGFEPRIAIVVPDSTRKMRSLPPSVRSCTSTTRRTSSRSSRSTTGPPTGRSERCVPSPRNLAIGCRSSASLRTAASAGRWQPVSARRPPRSS